MAEIVIFYSVVAKGFAFAVEMPSKSGEHLVVLKNPLFEVLPLPLAQPKGLIAKNKLIQLPGQEDQL